MSRHRIVRSMNYSDEYDGYDDVYGHSVEDDYSMSPSEAAFMYDRNNRQQAQISAFLTSDNIAEEDESETSINDSPNDIGRRDSQSSIRPHLSDIDEARLRSCLDEVRNVIGDSFSENILVDTILRSEFDVTRTLDELLKSPYKTKKEESPKPQRVRNPLQKEKQDDKDISFSNNRIKKKMLNNCLLKTVTSSTVSKKSDFSDGGRSKLKSLLKDVNDETDKILNLNFDNIPSESHKNVKSLQKTHILGSNSSKLKKPNANDLFSNSSCLINNEKIEGSSSLSELYYKHGKTALKSDECDISRDEVSVSHSEGLKIIASPSINLNSHYNNKDDSSDDGGGSGLSSLSSLRRKHRKDSYISDDNDDDDDNDVIETKTSLSSCNADTTEDRKLKTFSLMDLLANHKKQSIDCESKSIIDTSLSRSQKSKNSTSPSLDELFLKHNEIDVNPNSFISSAVDNDELNEFYEPERSSSLSRLAERYQKTSLSLSDDSNLDGSVNSLLELAVRHRQNSTSMLDEDTDVTDFSSSQISSVGSLPNKFKSLKVNANDDAEMLSRSFPSLASMQPMHNFNPDFKFSSSSKVAHCSAGQDEVDSSQPIDNLSLKKQVQLDLTSALQSPNQHKSKADQMSVHYIKNNSPIDDNRKYFVDFIDEDLKVKKENSDQLSPGIKTVLLNSFQFSPLIVKHGVVKMENKRNLTSSSPFGKVLCKRLKINNIPPLYIPDVPFRNVIHPFDFIGQSPDDKILSFLGKRRPNY